MLNYRSQYREVSRSVSLSCWWRGGVGVGVGGVAWGAVGWGGGGVGVVNSFRKAQQCDLKSVVSATLMQQCYSYEDV